MQILKPTILLLTSAVALTAAAVAVSQQPPPPRTHTVIKKGTLQLMPSDSQPPVANNVTIEVVGDERVITSNAVPAHAVGMFPNRGNPNRIRPQQKVYRVPAEPRAAIEISRMPGEFGVAVNGVPFDPGAGEFFAGEPGWQYEPLSGAINLGIDVSHAHVQPNGKYHYHGLPTGLLDDVKLQSGTHSPLIGWAADGFPIYAVYGYSDGEDATSTVQRLKSSYRLKAGDRPGGDAPGGTYDGTFVADYEYVNGLGDLDECNGRYAVTPEFPEGTYAYFLTVDWPVIPRAWRGTPSADFLHREGGGRRRGAARPGRSGPPRGGPGDRGLGDRGPGGRPNGRGPGVESSPRG